MNDRRTFLGLAGAAGVSLLLFGRATGAPARGSFAVTRSSADWRRLLGAQRYAILREAGTERPFHERYAIDPAAGSVEPPTF